MFARDNREFVKNVVETYGPVAKLQLFLGVGIFNSVHDVGTHVTPRFQTKLLHVYDPKALHSVFVKDQDHFDRGVVALAYVPAIMFSPTSCLSLGEGPVCFS